MHLCISHTMDRCGKIIASGCNMVNHYMLK